MFDLDVCDVELWQVGEASVAGAEVVERHRRAKISDTAGERLARLHVSHQRGFGDLEHDVCRIGASVARLALDP
jgi:hypothetical protein